MPSIPGLRGGGGLNRVVVRWKGAGCEGGRRRVASHQQTRSPQLHPSDPSVVSYIGSPLPSHLWLVRSQKMLFEKLLLLSFYTILGRRYVHIIFCSLFGDGRLPPVGGASVQGGWSSGDLAKISQLVCLLFPTFQRVLVGKSLYNRRWTVLIVGDGCGIEEWVFSGCCELL